MIGGEWLMVTCSFNNPKDLAVLEKMLGKRPHFNGIAVAFTLAATAYMILSELHNYNLGKKIKSLSKDFFEIKRILSLPVMTVNSPKGE
jgi:hypothetical protein